MIALLVLVALVVVGLELNRRRQSWLPRGDSTGVPDRDVQRLLADLRSAADRSWPGW